jgi:hypothetical protein
MYRGRTVAAVTLAIFGFTTGPAVEAALIDRGGGLIYDTVLDVTWLRDANYARTSGFDTDGLMTWQVATGWASSLVYADPIRQKNWDDWRLPVSLQPDPGCTRQNSSGTVSWSFGFNCVGSEMGHLFQVALGGVAGYSIDMTHGPAFSLFVDVQPAEYWSRTDFANDAANAAWTFMFQTGEQDADAKSLTHFAWAVRDGDVGARPAVVAEPSELVLLGLALGVLVMTTRFGYLKWLESAGALA